MEIAQRLEENGPRGCKNDCSACKNFTKRGDVVNGEIFRSCEYSTPLHELIENEDILNCICEVVGEFIYEKIESAKYCLLINQICTNHGNMCSCDLLD